MTRLGSNPGPSDFESDVLPTEPRRQMSGFEPQLVPTLFFFFLSKTRFLLLVFYFYLLHTGKPVQMFLGFITDISIRTKLSEVLRTMAPRASA